MATRARAAGACPKYPFLVRFCKSDDDDSSSTYQLYSSISKEWYLVDAPPELDDTRIHCSNYGWLLLSRIDRLFFFHPSTGNTIDLPNLSCSYNRLSFSAPPTRPDCVVFSMMDTCVQHEIYNGNIAILPRGESAWTCEKLANRATDSL
ncbi:unnamed protein product [Linum trigynum]|uniref:KIB1-4 beta-propeller domain-containing protein n=1 Tax=Linum trigynum TaxID=586398 RepID=A0AAV2CV79_9ROSI